MNTARVTSWGKPPQYIPGPALAAPTPEELQLKVLAVGIPRVVRGRASGGHYSSAQIPLPFDPSMDGVALDEATGDQYYVTPMAAPLLADRANVHRGKLIKLLPGADAVSVAGLVNPVSSSWLALQCRANGGCQGRIVFILGATSASGRLSATVARSLGATKIIGAARNPKTLADVEGLDERVVLQEPLVVPENLGPIDIVLDFVGGPSAISLLEAAEAPKGDGLQYVHVGTLSGENIMSLPLDLLRTKRISVVGSGMGSWEAADMKKELPKIVEAISKMKKPDSIWAQPMADVESAWDSTEGEGKRLVLVP